MPTNIEIHNNTNLEDQINRFPARVRPNIRYLVNENQYAADLLHSFPAILFAIASGYRTTHDRKEALSLIYQGHPLLEIAKSLKIPYWLRKAPAEAWKHDITSFPQDENCNHQLSGAFPSEIDSMANWLYYVPRAANYCDEEFAIWLAKQNIFMQDKHLENNIYALAVYAWFSKHPYSYAGSLIETPWNPRISYQRACRHIQTWKRKIKIELYIGKANVTDSWLSEQRVGDYTFRPLLKPKDLQQEAMQMNNCVEAYAAHIAANKSRIFGIRKRTKHVGTLEIRCDSVHSGKPTIHQLKGPNNHEASEAVWRATYKWLGRQRKYNLPNHSHQPTLNPKLWKQLWLPYWRTKGKVLYLLETPGEDQLGISEFKLME